MAGQFGLRLLDRAGGALAGVPIDVIEASVVMPPPTVDATGTQQVQAELEAWLATVPGGATIRFPPGARYRIGHPAVRVLDKPDWTIVWDGATFLRDPSIPNYPDYRGGNPHILFNRCDRLRLLGAVLIQGKEASFDYANAVEFQDGVRIYGSRGVLIDGAAVRNVGGDSLHVGVVGGALVRDATVRNVSSYGARRQAFSANNTWELLVEDWRAEWCGRSVWDLEPILSAVAGDVVFRRGYARALWNYVFACGRVTGAFACEDLDSAGGLGLALVGGRPGTGQPILRTVLAGSTESVVNYATRFATGAPARDSEVNVGDLFGVGGVLRPVVEDTYDAATGAGRVRLESPLPVVPAEGEAFTCVTPATEVMFRRVAWAPDPQRPRYGWTGRVGITANRIVIEDMALTQTGDGGVRLRAPEGILRRISGINGGLTIDTAARWDLRRWPSERLPDAHGNSVVPLVVR